MVDAAPSTIGKNLIKDFMRACRDLERAKSQLNSAECSYYNARDALGKFLVPSDAKPGEKFSIWGRDDNDNECLFEVTVPESTVMSHDVKVRY